MRTNFRTFAVVIQLHEEALGVGYDVTR